MCSFLKLELGKPVARNNVMAIKKTVQAASENVEKETAKGKVKVAWTIREVSILHALYPILGHDHEAYESVLPNRSA